MPDMSQAELSAFFCSVTQRVAENPKIGVKNWEFKSVAEIRADISSLSPDVLALLDKFFVAYQAWYDVHLDIEKQGIAGKLTHEQNSALLAAIDKRDRTRNALLAAL